MYELIETYNEARARNLENRDAYKEGLRGDQAEAFDRVVDALLDGKKIVKLVGYAGTGKTFLVARIANYLKNEFEVVLAAPTHKAAGVIREKLGDLDFEVSTIHSLLGLRLERDLSNDTGGRILRHKSTELSGLVICDEGSMIGTVLRQHIERKKNVQWLFVGDSAQLPPVGEGESDLLKDPDAVLKVVLRQADGSAILDLATAIREGDKAALTHCKGEDVIRVANADELFERAYERFSSPEYAEDCSFARMLVFRNQVREEINQKMRKLIIGSPVPFVEGEWLVMYEPFSSPGESRREEGELIWRCFSTEEIIGRLEKLEELAQRAKHYAEKTGSKSLWQDFFRYRDEQEQIRLHTSQEVQVERVFEAVADIKADWCPPLPIWALTIKTHGIRYRSIPVLKAEALPLFDEVMIKLRSEAFALSEKRDKERKGSDQWKALDDERRTAWKRFYLLDEMFATVDYAYAMTTHKAQGSTFSHVFLDLPDLIRSPKPMRQKLLYTAVTRPSDTLTYYWS